MGFFNFIDQIDGYGSGSSNRLNWRFKHIVEPFGDDLKAARVLDVAAHDGRWSYAFASMGAASVLGVEGRPELVERFANFPESRFKDRVRLKANELFDELSDLTDNKQTFDVVALFGILYHIMDHYRLMKYVSMLQPKLVIVDGEFIISSENIISLVRERTDRNLNAISSYDGQEFTVVGILSLGAMEQLADAIGYKCIWSNWDSVPDSERNFVKDYFRDGNKQRRTCCLRPINALGSALITSK